MSATVERRLRGFAGSLARRVLGSDAETVERLRQAYHRLRGGGVSAPVRGSLPFGVNLVGYLGSSSGVGEGARASLRALLAAGVPVTRNDLDSEAPLRNQFAVNLVHVNADQTVALLRRNGAAFLSGRYNIGFWYWELEEFPARFRPSFTNYHEIWVASEFCRRALARVSTVPVLTMPPALELPDGKSTPGGRPFRFVCQFDLLSGFERKNPLAVARAFRTAFSGSEDVQLVFKTSNGARDPDAMDSLRRACAGLKVLFIDESLSREAWTSLLASCDCYVSLHRAEGFGLPLAEAMALGKPVIATGYSGNLDFMGPENSLLVAFAPTRIAESLGPYPAGAIWAEPDEAQASAYMRQVFDNRESARALGERARADIRRGLAPETVGRSLAGRLRQVC